MNQLSPEDRCALQYWGKKNDSETHLLEYHLIDSALVAKEYLKRNPKLLDITSDLLGIDSIHTLSLITFLASIHDLGKIDPEFQRGIRKRKPHTVVGASLLYDSEIIEQIRAILLSDLGQNSRATRKFILDLLRPSLLHHGNPCAPSSECEEILCKLNPNAKLDALTIVNSMKSIFARNAPYYKELPMDSKLVSIRRATYLIAGIVSLSDWISSDAMLFEYTSQPTPLDKYRITTENKVSKLFDTDLKNLVHHRFELSESFEDLFHYSPTPCQQKMSSLDASKNGLIIIEDATGSGKTEAAIFFALRNIGSNTSDGIIFGLPTKSTSNLMYERLSRYHNLLGNEGAISLIHGDANRFLSDYKDIDCGPSPFERWAGNSNYKKLFSNVAICTVDQLLLATMRCRYEPLRLLSMIKHIVIVDEVHSYDSYTFGLLCALLNNLGTYNVPIILLSATLPSSMKSRLVKAYNPKADIPNNMGYPQILTTGNLGDQTYDIEPAKFSSRKVNLRYTSDIEHVLAEISALYKSEHTVCWIRNTVDDAIRAFEMLRKECPNTILIHSRFTLRDRLEKEGRVVEKCGKSAKSTGGLVVIGTQVLEQSLDIDFDRMFSDLAPADALIQRIGRNQRFNRSEIPCEFIIYGPELTDQPSEDWYSSFFRGASYVYKNHYSLWRTARIMNNRILHIPSDYRAIIEDAYSLPNEDNALYKSFIEFQNESNISNLLSERCVIHLDEGYRDEENWNELDANTRVSDDSVRLPLYKMIDGIREPMCETVEDSMINVHKKYLGYEQTDQELTMEQTGPGEYGFKNMTYSHEKGLRYAESD